MNKVLVTGVDGFIGSHLTEMLIRAGYGVRAFVLYNSFSSWGWLDHSDTDIQGKFEVFSGDIRDSHGVREAMKGCDAVLHLAALIAIPYSYHSPDTYVDTNVKGTLNVLQAARELGVQKVIHTSTSETYGTARFVPINEEHPMQGQSPYSATKIAADQLAYSFYASFNLPTDEVRIRPENSEVERLWADNQKAKKLLDWEPEYAGHQGFRRGLVETAEWFTDVSNLSKYKHKRYNI